MFIDTFRPVEKVMADFAALIGGGAVAAFDQQKADLADRVDELRAILGEKWEEVTASYLAFNTDGYEAWGPTSLPELDLLTRAGVSWVPIQVEADSEENGGYIGSISLERIGEFSADLILVQLSYDDRVLSTPLFTSLPAVEAGQIIRLTEEAAGSHFTNYLYVADLLLDALRELDLGTDLV